VLNRTPLSDLTEAEPATASRRDRRAERDKRRRTKQRRRRTWVAVLVSFAVLGGAVGVAYLGFRPIIAALTAPDDYQGEGTGEVTVTVEDGASGTAIGRMLQQAGVVKTAKAFTSAAADNPSATSVQPGTYRLRSQMSAASALAALLDPANRLVLKVTVPEGKRVPQVVDILVKAGLDKAGLETALADPTSLGLPASAKDNPEGYLFPATYEWSPQVTPAEALTSMVARARQAISQVGFPADQERELMIKASIIQAEGRNPADMGKIATVLDNRLAKGMKLALDSTVSYANNSFRLTTTAQERAVDSPYNTYRYAGLPAGPISSPGQAAMEAALNPTPGDWLFFVAVNGDTGETKFAVTAAEHAANVAEFQAWCREVKCESR
jgi:UPF0755 protein